MYDPQVYQKNKEYYLNYYKRKLECECGKISTYGNIARHRKSKKHLKLISIKQSTSNDLTKDQNHFKN